MAETFINEPNHPRPPITHPVGMTIDGRYLPPPEDGDGKIWVRTCALIQASAQRLYAMWRDVESAPLWQEQISRVTAIGERKSHWVMGSDGKTVEWDSEILADEFGRRIAWRSTGGDSNNAGEVVFEETPNGRGTKVTVLQEFRMGKLLNAWETLVGRNPKQSIIENLRHFKSLAETGEIPRIQEQPHGPRGVIGSMKESMYGENVTTPPGADRMAS